MKAIFYYQTIIGKIGIAEEDNQITNVFFMTDTRQKHDLESNSNSYYLNETETLRVASNQLDEYLQGKRKLFTLPLAPKGTTFMKKVWNSLCDIPYGKTKNYKEIAQAVGNGKACRAVGQANNKNPIPIFIPCHRVIGSKGNLIGYSGGLQTKLQLLELEKQHGNI